MHQLTLADIEAEIARAAGSDLPAGEALVVLLIPRGSPFEMYASAIEPGVEASQGRLRAVRIDTTAEPDAPARFNLSGSPGLVLFVNGRQVAAFAFPFAAAIPPMIGSLIEGAMSMVRNFLPPGAQSLLPPESGLPGPPEIIPPSRDGPKKKGPRNY